MNKEITKSLTTKAGLYIVGAATAVLAFFHSITCEQLQAWQEAVPKDVSSIAPWLGLAISLVMGGYSTKRTVNAHGVKKDG